MLAGPQNRASSSQLQAPLVVPVVGWAMAWQAASWWQLGTPGPAPATQVKNPHGLAGCPRLQAACHYSEAGQWAELRRSPVSRLGSHTRRDMVALTGIHSTKLNFMLNVEVLDNMSLLLKHRQRTK